MDARAYERRFGAQNLDAFASRVYSLDGSPVGVLLVARRGWTSRVAAMDVASIPALDGSHCTTHLLRLKVSTDRVYRS